MKALRVILIWLLILIGGHAVATESGELDAVRSLMTEGRLADAALQLDDFLARYPDDTDARFLKGLLLVEEGNTKEAIEVFTALARDYPDLPEPHNNLAVLYAADGDYEKARDSLLVAINTHPSYATAHENLGDLYAKMAAAAYDSALSLDQGNRAAQAKLALVNELFSEPAPESGTGGASEVARTSDSRAVDGVLSTAPAVVDDGRDKVLSTLSDWAAAWSSRDVDSYLGYYAENFRPPRGMSRAGWEAQRRQRLRKPRYIQVSLSDTEVRIESPGDAQVSFVQTYRSNTYSDRTRKSVQMTRVGEEWKILSEQVVR